MDDSYAESTRITPEEAAILQSYPKGFTFCGNKGKVGLQIGNAVPPLVARAILSHLWGTAEPRKHVVLDLFAGSGVGVAVTSLGAHDLGVESMPEAIATREANGLHTIAEDVWDEHVIRPYMPEVTTLWASPPCPTFSAAGAGSGRRQMPLIVEAINRCRWMYLDGNERDLYALKPWAESLEDERSGLTLVPLHYIYWHKPRFVVLEQVPAVLPIWAAYAEMMRGWQEPYSVWTGYLHSEQYGVPQTRKRAYLIARLDGQEATPPPPTHSKYHQRTPAKLDPDVLPWVSMTEALSDWQDDRLYASAARTSVDTAGARQRESSEPVPTVTAKTLSQAVRVPRPAPTVTGGGHDDGWLGAVRNGRAEGDSSFAVVSNYGTGGDPRNRGVRMSTEPSATVTSKFDRFKKEAT